MVVVDVVVGDIVVVVILVVPINNNQFNVGIITVAHKN